MSPGAGGAGAQQALRHAGLGPRRALPVRRRPAAVPPREERQDPALVCCVSVS